MRQANSRHHGAIAFAAVSCVSVGVLTAIALGDDPITFSPWTQYTTTNNSSGVDVADFDDDGDMDLAVSNRETDDVSILWNNGDGTFAEPVHYFVGDFPRYVIAADFNNDCLIDFATVEQSDFVSIVLNHGDGTFGGGPNLFVFRGTWLGATDIDGDGDQDVIVTGLDETMSDPVKSPGIVKVLRNYGAFFGVDARYQIQQWPRGGAIADLNTDGHPDIVIANLDSNSISVLMHTGVEADLHDSVHFPVGLGPRYLTTADFDGDDDIDIAVVHKNSNDLWLLRNDGSGAFTSSTDDQYPVHDHPHSVTAGDLDSDGDLEIVVSHVGASWLDVFVNDGEGGLTNQSMKVPPGGAHVTTGDLDGDGALDVITANGWTDVGSAVIHFNDTIQLHGPCVGDLDDNDVVEFVDLLTVISYWGPCSDPCGEACPGDADDDAEVGLTDLLAVLSTWGECG